MNFKNLLIATLCFVPAASFASVPVLSCQGRWPDAPNGVTAMEFTGAFVGDWIKDAIISVHSVDYKNENLVETGRAAQLDSDDKYQPRKYAGHLRFDLSRLTDVKDFSQFAPMDQCQIQIMIPENAAALGSFTAPVLLHCDQTGGAMNLQCQLGN
jgi:hypothetical protein